MPENEDNIAAAIDAVMRSESLTRKTNTNSEPGKPANKQFLLRMTNEEHEEWRLLAEAKGVSMAEVVRDSVRKEINEHHRTLNKCQRSDCNIVSYPWGTTVCTSCNKRFAVSTD